MQRSPRLVVHVECGIHGVTSPDAPGAWGVGRSRAAAVRDFREAAAELAAFDVDTRAAARMRVTFDREVDGRHIGEIRRLPGCLAYGRTKAEAEARVRALAHEIIRDKVQHGERVPGVRGPVKS